VKAEVREAKEVAKADPKWLRWYWPIFTIVAALAFAIPEAVGIISKGKGGTYTEWIKRQIGVDPPKPHKRVTSTIFVVVLGLFAVWFGPHIITQWPWES
jgi:hypothetical protein